MTAPDLKTVIAGMKPWFALSKTSGHLFPDMRSESIASRTSEQRVWDHAVLTVAEFVRRMQDNDETLALQIHQFMNVNLPKG